jgi:hypothetical protein
VALSVVQHKSLNSSSSGTSLALTFTSNVTSGDLIVVVVETASSGSAIITAPTDGQSNTYHSAVDYSPPATGTPSEVAIWFTTASATGSLTVTAHISASHHIDMAIYQIHSTNGVFASDTTPFDQSGTHLEANPATSASVSTSGATTVANEYVIAGFGVDNHASDTWTKDTNYGDVETANNTVASAMLFTEDRIVSSTGTQTATATDTTGDTITDVIATFKEPASGTVIPVLGERAPASAVPMTFAQGDTFSAPASIQAILPPPVKQYQEWSTLGPKAQPPRYAPSDTWSGPPSIKVPTVWIRKDPAMAEVGLPAFFRFLRGDDWSAPPSIQAVLPPPVKQYQEWPTIGLPAFLKFTRGDTWSAPPSIKAILPPPVNQYQIVPNVARWTFLKFWPGDFTAPPKFNMPTPATVLLPAFLGELAGPAKQFVFVQGDTYSAPAKALSAVGAALFAWLGEVIAAPAKDFVFLQGDTYTAPPSAPYVSAFTLSSWLVEVGGPAKQFRFAPGDSSAPPIAPSVSPFTLSSWLGELAGPAKLFRFVLPDAYAAPDKVIPFIASTALISGWQGELAGPGRQFRFSLPEAFQPPAIFTPPAIIQIGNWFSTDGVKAVLLSYAPSPSYVSPEKVLPFIAPALLAGFVGELAAPAKQFRFTLADAFQPPAIFTGIAPIQIGNWFSTDGVPAVRLLYAATPSYTAPEKSLAFVPLVLLATLAANRQALTTFGARILEALNALGGRVIEADTPTGGKGII